MYADDVAGFFYVNGSDNRRLYRMYDDGKTNVKLTDEEVDSVRAHRQAYGIWEQKKQGPEGMQFLRLFVSIFL